MAVCPRIVCRNKANVSSLDTIFPVLTELGFGRLFCAQLQDLCRIVVKFIPIGICIVDRSRRLSISKCTRISIIEWLSQALSPLSGVHTSSDPSTSVKTASIFVLFWVRKDRSTNKTITALHFLLFVSCTLHYVLEFVNYYQKLVCLQFHSIKQPVLTLR